jgi:hypothetical protein
MTNVLLIYKSFSTASHAGLGVSALNCLKVLRANGISSQIWQIDSTTSMIAKLEPVASTFTHVVVSAPWIATADWHRILRQFPSIQFSVNTHSNVGFLQADPNAVRLIREGQSLEQGSANFRIAANCHSLRRWLIDAYASPCAYLPNLYWLDGTTRVNRPLFSGSGGTLRIGCFGATRPLKNQVTAAAAALEIASRLKVTLEFWISGGRPDGGQVAVAAMEQIFAGVPYATLKRTAWEDWPAFRKIVSGMHLLMQPTYTESFNLVTADGIAEGVPSVVSEAIEWVPDHWHADNDDVFEVARVGRQLLSDPGAAQEGLDHLKAYNRTGVAAWRKFLMAT